MKKIQCVIFTPLLLLLLLFELLFFFVVFLWIPSATSSPPARLLHRPLPISSSSMLFSKLSYRSLFTIHRPLIQQPLLNTVCCRAEKRGKMGFIMEFAENLVLKLMEDPKERDRRFREHVYRVKDRCEKTKEMWSYPMRPYGFWTFERHNSQLAWDAQISQVPGRRDPYDDLLQHYSAPPK